MANNYYKDWSYYAVGARSHAHVMSSHNVYEAGRKQEVTPWFNGFSSDASATIVSSKDMFLKRGLNSPSFSDLEH